MNMSNQNYRSDMLHFRPETKDFDGFRGECYVFTSDIRTMFWAFTDLYHAHPGHGPDRDRLLDVAMIYFKQIACIMEQMDTALDAHFDREKAARREMSDDTHP